ncbi:MAG: M50 family metallopeptidase [Bacillota bacterium]
MNRLRWPRADRGKLPQVVLGRVECRVHLLFWFLLFGAVVTGRFLEILTLFGIVFIHEWGHVSMAKSFGWKIREIELLPFGGVARFDDAPESWRQEVCVILAGPLTNVAMIPFSYLFGQLGWWPPPWVDYFVTVNLIIAGFNLLPFPPLDGGRLLHVLAACVWPYLQSLRQSVWAGLAGAVCLGGFALLGWQTGTVHLNLLLIAAFLGFHNVQEWRQIPYRFLRFLLHRQRHPELSRRFRPLMLPVVADWSIRQGLERMYRERYHLFVHPPGNLIREEELLRHYFDGHGSRTIRELMP